jgi:hypothetical protein
MDLFDHYQKQPPTLQKIVSLYADKEESEGLSYDDCAEFLKLVNRIGFTFEYGLDATPFNLTQLKNKIK